MSLGQLVPGGASAKRGMLVDFELVARARKGEEGAFGEIVRAYRRRILGTVARLIGRREDVEDVAQGIFLRLYESLGRLRTPEVFEVWLHRLTVNASYDYLRRKRRRPETLMAELPPLVLGGADAAVSEKRHMEEREREQVRETVEAVLRALPASDRVLLTLKEVEGLSLKELEKVLNVRENALKVRLYRARQRALKVLSAMEAGENRRAST